MSDLAEFLLERFASERAIARSGLSHYNGDPNLGMAGLAVAPEGLSYLTPQRLEREAEAKRRLVEQLDAADPHGGYITAEFTAGDALRLLALPYADHEDYREEWRP